MAARARGEHGGEAAPPADPRPARGRQGEEEAVRRLVAAGFEILARNLAPALPGGGPRRGVGEIDILARDGACVAAIEVRRRDARSLVSPAATVNPRKIRRLCAALGLLLDDPAWGPVLAGHPLRFDVMALRYEHGRVVEAVHLRDAFRCPRTAPNRAGASSQADDAGG